MAEAIVARIVDDAEAWTRECGLAGRLSLALTVTACGFKVHVDEAGGLKFGTCTYQRDGSRSMWELDKKGA